MLPARSGVGGRRCLPGAAETGSTRWWAIAIGTGTGTWLVFALVGALGILACTSRVAEPQIVAESSSSDAGTLAPEASGQQYLFQVRYAGPAGSGNLRLILRVREEDDFQLVTADTFGRLRWSLEYRRGDSLLLDHQREKFCRGGGNLALGETSLEVLPLGSLPGVLLGLLPVELPRRNVGTGSVEVVDGEGRKWSIRGSEQQIQAWTLWQGEQPLLWWTRQPKGGILSHRDGSQFRWRRVVEEVLSPTVTDLVVPEGYGRVDCDEYELPELRQD